MDLNAKFRAPQTVRKEAVTYTRVVVGVVYLDTRDRSVMKVPVLSKKTMI